MCGIVGYVGSFGPERLASANRCIAHRGPDADGMWISADQGVGLAHRRLSIIDLSESGAQPMVDDARCAVLVFNGEIYNFQDLRRELVGRGVQFRGRSDTEVLLQMYLLDGPDMLRRLNGIFAFALWDERARSLLVARDGLGVKPLYYLESASGFACASEIKALLHLEPNARSLDVVALQRYLSFLWCPGEQTPLQVVRKLGPGEAAIVRDGRIARRWSWYELPSLRNVTPDLDAQSAVTATAEGLRRAVHRQLVSDVPVGAFLSGGLDSSAVVAFARERVPDIRCFTIEATEGAEEGTTDDLPFARRVAAHLGVPLDVVTIDARRMADDVAAMIAQLDEPLADPAPLNVLYISRLARQHGIKVLLSGAGGDDLFSGYRRHLALRYQRLWAWLPGSIRRAAAAGTTHLDQRRPVARRLAKLLDGAALEGDERIANYFVWARERDLQRLWNPDLRAIVAREAPAQVMTNFLDRVPKEVSPLERMLALEQRFFLADHNLTYTDKMSMAAGVEVRVPFLDLDLVEIAARVPANLKQHGREGKWVLKKAMTPYLPGDVIHRPKSGFGAPLRRWMRHELKPLVSDMLSESSIRRRGLFDPAAVTRLVADNDSGRVDAAYTLLSLLSIELWCRAFIDQPSAGVR